MKKLVKEKLMFSTKLAQEKVRQDLTLLVALLIQRILTIMNTVVNMMKKSSCASLRFLMLEMSPQLVPIILEKFLAMVYSINMDL